MMPGDGEVGAANDRRWGLPAFGDRWFTVVAGSAGVWCALQIVGILAGLVLVGRNGGGATQAWDDTVHDWFIDHRGGLVGLSKLVAFVGNAPQLGVIVATVTVVVACLVWRNHALQWRMFGPFAAYLGAEVTVYIVRLVVHRPRPLSAVYPNPGAIAGVNETSWSFPSGHATGSMAVFVALAGLAVMRWPRARWGYVVAVVAAAAVASTRLVLGVHWFTDVATGMVLGGAWGVTVCWAQRHVDAEV